MHKSSFLEDSEARLKQSGGLRLSLAIESSTRDASLVLADCGHPILYLPLNPQFRTAATISESIAVLLAKAEELGRSIDYVAVADGPGSFTGLRIGVTSAKTLTYALQCRLVGVDSLAAIASGLWESFPDAQEVIVALNAYRSQVFAARWTPQQWRDASLSGDFTAQSDVWSAEQWNDELAKTSANTIVGAEAILAKRLTSLNVSSPGDASSIPATVVTVEPSARQVAKLAHQLALLGRFTSAMELMPRYLRDSAAEEKLG